MKSAKSLRPSVLVPALALAAWAMPAVAEDQAPELPRPDRPTTGYVWAEPEDMAGGSFSRTLFLNNCEPGGCTVYYGDTSSISDRSFIPENGQSLLDDFAGSASDWAEFMECMRETFAPFDVDVTDIDPGGESHMEVMVAGHPNDLGLENGIGGIAPYYCGYIPNSLSFAFADVYGGDMIELCATAAQEVAHTWGLDHQMLASDPMTYLNYNGQRSFKNQAVPCGEYQNRSCSCGGNTQNSYQEILSLFGGSDPTPPDVEITAPDDNSQVGDEFVIRATVTDETGVTRVELWIDGAMIQATTLEPYVFNAPASLDEGTHDVEIRAYDSQDTMGSAEITVILGEPCRIPGDCAAAGDGFTCVGGRCVPGDGVVGGLGTECSNGQDCFSGICASDGSQKLCGEECVPEAGQCPSGYGCLPDNNGGGVCWPGVEEGGCGGCAGGSGGSSALPIALGLAFAALLGPRRRRRRTA